MSEWNSISFLGCCRHAKNRLRTGSQKKETGSPPKPVAEQPCEGWGSDRRTCCMSVRSLERKDWTGKSSSRKRFPCSPARGFSMELCGEQVGWAGQGPAAQSPPRFTASFPLILSCTTSSEPCSYSLIAENSLFFLFFFFLSIPRVEVVNKCTLNVMKLSFLLLLHFHFYSIFIIFIY